MDFLQMPFKGLTDEEVAASRLQFGRNALQLQSQNNWVHTVVDMLKEPMLLMLIAAAGIYFVSGQIGDGIFMLMAIVIVTAISLYQETKSKNALDALKNLSVAKAKVVRNGMLLHVDIDELVTGDCMLLEEGMVIPADGTIVKSNDFCVNESILTGEAFPVNKHENADADNQTVFRGTTVVAGLAFCTITAVGNSTRWGKIGVKLEQILEEETPLQQQIHSFVNKMMLVGLLFFVLVWGLNFWNSHSLLDSLLKALTLAMSIVPEEIPVTFSTFMALGAWRMMKMGLLVKQTKTVEALGSATVICTDKTGTLTENNMQLVSLYEGNSQQAYGATEISNHAEAIEVLKWAVLASEPTPFDPMEKALHEAFKTFKQAAAYHQFQMMHEYPLEGVPPMMTHIYQSPAGVVAAAKGAPEAILRVCKALSDTDKAQINHAVLQMANQGYRVLAVAAASHNDNASFPEQQQQFPFRFVGLTAFFDPPKTSVAQVFESLYKAGIQVKIVTGDSAITTAAIAKQVGFKNAEAIIEGDALMQMENAQLQQTVKQTAIFTRMFPEAKLKLIEALKSGGAIVAMTGDGVNDGPALKAAHIGVAMGKRGTEIAKKAASLILMNDDLLTMTDAVAMGRKIYTNIKKAIRYVISIHIPIVLIVFIPLIAHWQYPYLFTPVHIIFLELIMGPTCSIIYENEPMEPNTMLQPPRPFSKTFFSNAEIVTSLLQGLAITLGLIAVYFMGIHQEANEQQVRTMVFITLISANIFLTLINRSFYYSILTTLLYKNKLVFWMIGATVLLCAGLLCIPTAAHFFGFTIISTTYVGTSIFIGALSVLWYEIVKWMKRRNSS